MKFILIGIFLISTTFMMSQSNSSRQDFDFWVGTWEVQWPEGEGQIGKGINTIEKTLDGKVLQENFQILEGQNKGFKGTSVSVFNPNTAKWKQAWVDNSGGYFDFTGGRDEQGNPLFITETTVTDSTQTVQRMIFKNISKDSFTWDWEGSKDGGQSWNLLWQIEYNKIIPPALNGENAFDFMMGTCNCKSSRMGQNGEWQKESNATWHWEYIMNGAGIQDHFTLSDGTSGGSIRQFNSQTGKWFVHYYSSNSPNPQLQSWEGSLQEDGTIQLYSPQKLASGEEGFIKLTFYNLSKEGYEWKAELVNQDESNIQPFWRITCRR